MNKPLSSQNVQSELKAVSRRDFMTRTAAAAAPLNVHAALVVADLDVLEGDWAAAFNRLVECIRATSGDDRSVSRARLLEFFVMAGDDPAVAPARVALANALF